VYLQVFPAEVLSLRKTNICKLPLLLGKLKRLETLDIWATLVKKLPASANNLSCMKHLLLGHKEQLTRTAGVKYLKPSSGVEMAPGMVKTQEHGRSSITCPYNGQGVVIGAVGDWFAAKYKEAQCSVPQCGS